MSNIADEEARTDWHAERPDADPVDFDHDDAMRPFTSKELASLNEWAHANNIPDEPPF